MSKLGQNIIAGLREFNDAVERGEHGDLIARARASQDDWHLSEADAEVVRQSLADYRAGRAKPIGVVIRELKKYEPDQRKGNDGT